MLALLNDKKQKYIDSIATSVTKRKKKTKICVKIFQEFFSTELWNVQYKTHQYFLWMILSLRGIFV